MTDLQKQIKERTQAVREQMQQAARASGRNIADIMLLAASKTQTPETVAESRELGMDLFGENRVQELEEKAVFGAYGDKKVNLIGHVQSNKAKIAVKYASVIESVDSIEIAQAIANAATKIGKTQDVLVEINIANEESKFGILPKNLDAFLCEICNISGVHVQGLMTNPPISLKKGQNSRFFANLYKLFIDIKAKKYDNISMSILSMGMSRDFCEAIAEGSNIVRIGTGIFGERK